MEYPPVSVVMPVRNEERHLAEAVRHVLGQDYPGEFELVLAVGPSADRTEQIARDLAAAEPRLTVVANPAGKIPAALNAAVRAARHAVIARVDGHALLPSGYLATAVATLTETGAADVGGVMAAVGVTTFRPGRGLGHDLQGRRGLGRVPHRRRGGPGGQRLPRRLPPRGDRAGRRLGRGDAPRRGLGPELPHPGPRRPDLVHPRPPRHLPAARQRPRPRRAVLPLRPLAAGDRPRAPGDGQLPLPGPARRGGPGHDRPGHWPRRPGRHGGRRAGPRAMADRRPGHPRHLPGRRHRGRCRPGPRRPGAGADPAYRSSSPPCTWPGGPASSPARAGCTASPTPRVGQPDAATESAAAAGAE